MASDPKERKTDDRGRELKDEQLEDVAGGARDLLDPGVDGTPEVNLPNQPTTPPTRPTDRG